MAEHPQLVQPLPDGPLDIVGDVHGEHAALASLLALLGYDARGQHPQGRKLVFVGDLCDRGPDSVRVVQWVREMVAAGNAFSVAGNHELNLLRADAKDGSGWFFDERLERDQRYQPFARPDKAQLQEIIRFLGGLPLVLERADLRVVHAAWQQPDIDMVRAARGVSASQLYDQADAALRERLRADGSYQRYRDALHANQERLEDRDYPMPFLEAIAVHDEACQAGNAVKVLTSGVERRAKAPFYSSHKWRFVARVGWWDRYEDSTPVVVGHYWRSIVPTDRSRVGKGDQDLFAHIGPCQWHGKRHNVFCVDFSVGGRWAERRDHLPADQVSRLAALRWPERELVFDTGERRQTTGFCAA
jgi:hypothetical protein